MDDQNKVVTVFLPPPDFLEEKLREAEQGGVFRFDPAVYIPAEIPVGLIPQDTEQHGADFNFDSTKLTIDMFVSGMLRYLSREPGGEDAGYYRKAARALRPEILREFSTAAIAKMRLGDWEMALEIANILAGVFPGAEAILHLRSEIMRERSRALGKTGMAEIAEAAEDEAKKAERREETHQFFNEVRELIVNNKADAALPLIRAKLDDHPKSWRLWFTLGWALRCLSKWEDAAKALEHSIALREERGRTPGAGEAAEAALESRNELAICYVEMGRPQDARRELEKALEENNGSVKVMSNLGVLAMKRGDVEEAERFFRTVLEFDSNDEIAKKFFMRN
jgi:tetratricopeptide (TPR) repeat protein